MNVEVVCASEEPPKSIYFSDQTFSSSHHDYEEYKECCGNIIIYSAHEDGPHCDKEEALNSKWNDIIAQNPKKSNIVSKMNSDNKLQGFKDKIVKATEGLKKHSEALGAAALVVKHHGIITIVESGFGDEFRQLNPNHFLYYSIFERYKPYFNFCNIGGISSFEEDAQFKGLNNYRLKWNPLLFEFIGEFDLVCSEYYFKKLINSSYIEKEFTNAPINKNNE